MVIRDIRRSSKNVRGGVEFVRASQVDDCAHAMMEQRRLCFGWQSMQTVGTEKRTPPCGAAVVGAVTAYVTYVVGASKGQVAVEFRASQNPAWFLLFSQGKLLVCIGDEGDASHVSDVVDCAMTRWMVSTRSRATSGFIQKAAMPIV